MTAKNNAGKAAGQAAALPADDRSSGSRPGDYVAEYPGQTADCRRETLAQQLWALTATLHGDGGESFRNYSDEIQSGVLWLVHDLAQQIRDLS